MNNTFVNNEDELKTALEFLQKNDLLSNSLHTAALSIATDMSSSFVSLSSQSRDKFKEEIRKIADTTNALFITGKLLKIKIINK